MDLRNMRRRSCHDSVISGSGVSREGRGGSMGSEVTSQERRNGAQRASIIMLSHVRDARPADERKGPGRTGRGAGARVAVPRSRPFLLPASLAATHRAADGETGSGVPYRAFLAQGRTRDDALRCCRSCGHSRSPLRPAWRSASSSSSLRGRRWLLRCDRAGSHRYGTPGPWPGGSTYSANVVPSMPGVTR